MDKLKQAFELFDDYNKRDPNLTTWENETYSYEYFYALQLYKWVLKLEPNASEALLLASRSQHIGRWEIKRDAYPAGKAGYLKWRSDLGKYHAEKAGELMKNAGIDGAIIEQAQKIILKKQIKVDAEVQVMENALCLVFLQFQFEAFLKKHIELDEPKVIHILKKTWTKMSDTGHEAALLLNYSDEALALIQKALA